jgi:uncharacterized protein YlxP (DUF503 family)
MTIGILRIQLRVYAGSLKEKRSVVKSLIERVRARYNVAIAEVGQLDALDAATIGVACISNEAAHADAMLQKIADFIEVQRIDADVEAFNTELIQA